MGIEKPPEASASGGFFICLLHQPELADTQEDIGHGGIQLRRRA
jgi:hypothetical protein